MNVIGFDDGPFERAHRGRVLLVGAVCAATRLDGVIAGDVERDGSDSTQRIAEVVQASQFGGHVRAVMLQGIAVGGFNVVDVHELARLLEVPVLVVMRRRPDMSAVQRALFTEEPHHRARVPGAAAKWRLIEAAGPVEALALSKRKAGPGPTGLRNTGPRLFVQRVGLSADAACRLVAATTLHGNVPEPLRLAHLIAGGVTTGRSRGRA